MCKKVNRLISLLLVLVIASWTLITLSAYKLAFNKVYAFNISQQQETELIEEKEEEIDPLLLRSIELCKKEFTEEIAIAVIAASKKYNVPIEVVYALIATESGENGTNEININNIMNINTSAVSNYSCIGAMQIHPKTALIEYNKVNNTNYTKKDLYDISLNIEIGVWYYTQFKTITTDWVELYVIYNVGYGRYNKVNKNWFYGWDGKWRTEYKNKFFFMNDMYPPTDNAHGVYGKNKLKRYGARKRFEVCYKLCKEYFNA